MEEEGRGGGRRDEGRQGRGRGRGGQVSPPPPSSLSGGGETLPPISFIEIGARKGVARGKTGRTGARHNL